LVSLFLVCALILDVGSSCLLSCCFDWCKQGGLILAFVCFLDRKTCYKESV
jgi:hypothetical protein